MARARTVEDHIFLIIGDHAFTLKDLGPAADMRIDAGMQSIIDQGLLGEDLIGKPWYTIIKSSGMKLEAAPNEDETLQYTLYQKYEEALEQCKELSRLNKLTQADKDNMMKLRQNWEAATKLAKP